MPELRSSNNKYRKVPTAERLGYGAGHIYNDMVTAFLLSFIAVYVKVGLKLDVIYAGYILFVILITDALTRPLIMLASRKLNICKCVGKRKSLHIVGMVLLTASIILSFSTLFGGEFHEIVRFFCYVPVFILLATAFTCIQVSHKAILRQMTGLTSEKVFISTWRTMSSLVANIAVFIVATIFLSVQGRTESSVFVDGDEIIFRNISYFIIATGVVCCVMFYLLVPEQRTKCVCLCLSKKTLSRQNAVKRKSQETTESFMKQSQRKNSTLQQLNVNQLQVRAIETNSVQASSTSKTQNKMHLPKIIVTREKSENKEVENANGTTSSVGTKKVVAKPTTSVMQRNLTPVSKQTKVSSKPDESKQRDVPNVKESLSQLEAKSSTIKINNAYAAGPSNHSDNETKSAGNQNLSVITKLKLVFRRKKKMSVSLSDGNNDLKTNSYCSNNENDTRKPLRLSTLSKIKTVFKRTSNVADDINSSQTKSSVAQGQTAQTTSDNDNKSKKNMKFRTVGKDSLALKPSIQKNDQSMADPKSSNSSGRKTSRPKLSTLSRIAAFFQKSKNKPQPGTSSKRSSISSDKQNTVPPPSTYRRPSATSVQLTNGKKKAWYKGMCKKPKFYKTAVIHACSRLALVVSQVFMPLYLTETLMMDKIAIALIPLIIYVSGFATSLITRKINQKYGRKRTYAIGEAATLGAAVWLFLIHESANFQVYMAAVLLGIGLSTMQVRSASMVTDLTGSPVDRGAAFFSVNEKVIQAIAILLLQIFNPCSTNTTDECKTFYRSVMLSMTGGSTFLGFAVLTLAKILGLETEEGVSTSLEVTEDGVGISSGL